MEPWWPHSDFYKMWINLINTIILPKWVLMWRCWWQLGDMDQYFADTQNQYSSYSSLLLCSKSKIYCSSLVTIPIWFENPYLYCVPGTWTSGIYLVIKQPMSCCSFHSNSITNHRHHLHPLFEVTRDRGWGGIVCIWQGVSLGLPDWGNDSQGLHQEIWT